MTDTTNFDAAIGNDPRLLARWEATREKVLADARAAGFLPVTCGPRLLRTETAAIAAATLVQGLAGDLC